MLSFAVIIQLLLQQKTCRFVQLHQRSLGLANASQSSAGKGTRDIAAARPWTGTETLENAAFRMLDDAHKPLRVSGGKSRIPSPVPVDLRPKQKDTATGAQRLANARDKTSIYSLAKDNTMSDKEKQELRKQFKDRFAPGARSIPATIQGLQGVASQRIEDAIARGLFKNIPRGKGVNTTRDHNADSPFIDTTEYFMNKIVKKQELTPPWIEKQAEIHRAASVFRSRLRADWKRHAARTIASKGGSIEDQIQRAMEYAEAEAIENSPPVKREIMTGIDNQGNLTRVKIEEQSPGSDEDADVKIIVTETEAPQSPATKAQSEQPQPMALEKVRRAPFRDPSWEALESSYHTLAVTQLNNLTRSYNLMAPDLAKKPYYSLQRELRSCYGEVAPQLSDEIRERSRAPRAKIEVVGHRPGGVMEKFGAGETAKVYDDRRAPYGFKEFWRDLFNAGKQGV